MKVQTKLNLHINVLVKALLKKDRRNQTLPE